MVDMAISLKQWMADVIKCEKNNNKVFRSKEKPYVRWDLCNIKFA